jgi:hypothetical protein
MSGEKAHMTPPPIKLPKIRYNVMHLKKFSLNGDFRPRPIAHFDVGFVLAISAPA